MHELRVTIIGWADDAEPGWVECRLVDAFDRTWTFIEKVPVISLEDLRPDSLYPRPATIACQLVERRIDATGREVFVVDTETPWGIEATSGETRFEVCPEQVIT